MAKFLTRINRIRLIAVSYLVAVLNKLISMVSTYLTIKSHKKHWQRIYSNFDDTNYESFTEHGLPNESTIYHGEIVKWARDINPRPKKTLLVGDNKDTAKRLQKILQVEFICTTGLSNVDYTWNFEESPPEMGQYDLIISQAILEHLLSPYKHVCDLVSILNPDGFLIIHTVCPGFPYHRYPIDTCRFYPDWFEEAANRLGVDIVKKRIKDTHIFYMYKKRQAN